MPSDYIYTLNRVIWIYSSLHDIYRFSLMAQWVKNPPEMQDWVVKFLERRKWQPTQVFWPEKSHRHRILMSYSPWGHKESGMIEQLSLYAGHDTSSSSPSIYCNLLGTNLQLNQSLEI